MPARTTGVFIVPDDARVIRVSEIAEMISGGKSQRQVAAELGVSTATINRQLRLAGYEVVQTIALRKVESVV